MQTWENIPKNQIDTETIEEAIVRLIAAHNNNEESHLGSGQSLQSHKASEIIDHLTSSVVSSSLRKFSVIPDHLAFDKIEIYPSFESLDCWTIDSGAYAALYLGGIYFRTPSTPDSQVGLFSPADILALDLSIGNPVFQTIFSLSHDDNIDLKFGVGQIDHDFFGFRIIDTELFTYIVSNESIFSSKICDINPKLKHSYRIVSSSGIRTEFYVDEELLYTDNINFPQDGEILHVFNYLLKTLNSTPKVLLLFLSRFLIDN